MGMPPTIALATLGMWDSLLLMVMALVVFGPRRLPEIARKLGKVMYEVRKASNDFKFQMEEELRKAGDDDQRQKEEERLRALTPPAQAATRFLRSRQRCLEQPSWMASFPCPAPTQGKRLILN